VKSIAAFLLASFFLVSSGVSGRAVQSPDNDKATQLLKQVVASTQAIQAMTCDITDIETIGGKSVQKTGTVKLLKPNFLLEEVWQSSASAPTKNEASPHEILASDGQTYWQIASDGTYFKDSASADGKNVGNTDSISPGGAPPDMAGFITLFFNPTMITQFDPSTGVVITNETWNGQGYRVLSQSNQSKDQAGHSNTITGRLYVGPDNLIHRLVIDAGAMGHLELQLLNIKTDATLTKTDFAFALPTWAKPAAGQ